jgi:hypothetical protein
LPSLAAAPAGGDGRSPVRNVAVRARIRAAFNVRGIGGASPGSAGVARDYSTCKLLQQ